MKAVLSLVAMILFLCSCVYDVPLTEEAVIPVDPALTGIWQKIPNEGEAEDSEKGLVILPFSKTEYVVVSDKALYFRAYPVHLEGMELIQLEWLGVDKEKDSPYHVCRYTLKDNVLTVETLNHDVVKSSIKDSASLRKALVENCRNPAMFEEQVRYRKLED